MSEDVVKTSIYLPDDLLVQLKTRALAERRKDSAVMRDAIRAYLNEPTVTSEPSGQMNAEEAHSIETLLDALRDVDPGHEQARSLLLANLKWWRDHVYTKKKALRSRDQRKRA